MRGSHWWFNYFHDIWEYSNYYHFLIDESNRDVLHKEKRKFDLVDLVRKLEHGLLGITEIIRISRLILLIFGRLHDKIE